MHAVSISAICYACNINNTTETPARPLPLMRYEIHVINKRRARDLMGCSAQPRASRLRLV